MCRVTHLLAREKVDLLLQAGALIDSAAVGKLQLQNLLLELAAMPLQHRHLLRQQSCLPCRCSHLCPHKFGQLVGIGHTVGQIWLRVSPLLISL